MIFCSSVFIGCEKKIDLSSKEPYIQSIGKFFVLQQDYYTFRFNDSDDLFIGKISEIPDEVNPRFIGLRFHEGIIIGIIKKGDLFQIKKIMKKNTIEDSYYDYYISISSQNTLINSSFLAISVSFHNPPFTKTWSDPPIFDPKAALPLPSDGIWWK
jgi:hypothetical protein